MLAAETCLARGDETRRGDAEQILREIDANFSGETLPTDLNELRGRLAALMIAPA